LGAGRAPQELSTIKMSQTQQQTHFNQARASLQQALSWYSSFESWTEGAIVKEIVL